MNARETLIEKYLVQEIKALGGIAYKFTSPNRRSVPDRLIVLPGLSIFFIEVKRPGGTYTKAQEREAARIKRIGHRVLLIDTKEKVNELIRHVRASAGYSEYIRAKREEEALIPSEGSTS